MKRPILNTYRIQSMILIALTVGLITPYVSAQVDMPSVVPSSLNQSQLSDQANTARDQLDAEARNRRRNLERSANDTLRQTLERVNVPSNPVDALSGANPENTLRGAQADGFEAVDQVMAGSNLPPADAPALVNGDASSLIDAGVTSPEDINRVISQANRAYTNGSNESLFARSQADWASGVRNLANCSSGDDDGKDFCQSLEDLKGVLNEIKADMRETVSAAHRLQAYVTAKPAFLNTPSLTNPVCNGLLLPGPSIPLNQVNIANTDAAYDPASGRLTLEAVKNELLAAGDLAENNSTLDNNAAALGHGINLIRNNNGIYSQNVAQLQGKYDALAQRVWQNFDTTMEKRFQTLRKHTEEMNTLANQLAQIQLMLAQRPRTP